MLGLPEWFDLNIIVPVSMTVIVVCVGILVVCVAVSKRKAPPMMNPGYLNNEGKGSSRKRKGRKITKKLREGKLR